MIVLGLESSCDETAVGIVADDRRILANQIATQLAEHKPYGGVVPEIAARAHLDHMDDLIRAALKEASLSLDDIDGIAATCGPGLIGGVMVAAMAGKAIAAVRKLPFSAVNHLEAHALTARLTDDVRFPYLLLLVSGGHSQILLVENVGKFHRLGTTIDDAVGECFDKSAKLLGLGYPGGPLLERAATTGNPKAFNLPRPMLGRPGCDFSFSGLKTAVRQCVTAQAENLSPQTISNIAASVQAAIVEILEDRVEHAFRLIEQEAIQVSSLVVAGGVASNQAIRSSLLHLAEKHGTPFVAPPISLCTDNGVMIAWVGLERIRLGLTDDLSFSARPRWPLDSDRQ